MGNRSPVGLRRVSLPCSPATCNGACVNGLCSSATDCGRLAHGLFFRGRKRTQMLRSKAAARHTQGKVVPMCRLPGIVAPPKWRKSPKATATMEPAAKTRPVARDSRFHIHMTIAAYQRMKKLDNPIIGVALLCGTGTSAGNATAASGRGRVERNPGRRELTSRWKVKGKTPSTAANSVHPRYSKAGIGPVSGNLRQPKSRLGMKLKATTQKSPRRGCCVPPNHTPRMGPAHAPTGEKKPMTKRLATAQATICHQRLDLTFVGIVRSFYSGTALVHMAGARFSQVRFK